MSLLDHVLLAAQTVLLVTLQVVYSVKMDSLFLMMQHLLLLWYVKHAQVFMIRSVFNVIKRNA